MAMITRDMVENELVPLLKTINEQVCVEDVTGGDLFYTDGTVNDALCKIIFPKVIVYIWANGDIYCPTGIRNSNSMNTIKEWLSPKFTAFNAASVGLIT
jgi:hypothetical protein